MIIAVVCSTGVAFGWLLAAAAGSYVIVPLSPLANSGINLSFPELRSAAGSR